VPCARTQPAVKKTARDQKNPKVEDIMIVNTAVAFVAATHPDRITIEPKADFIAQYGPKVFDEMMTQVPEDIPNPELMTFEAVKPMVIADFKKLNQAGRLGKKGAAPAQWAPYIHDGCGDANYAYWQSACIGCL
jgi:hypothetical protein